MRKITSKSAEGKGKATAKKATGQSRARAQTKARAKTAKPNEQAKAPPRKCEIPKADRVQMIVDMMLDKQWYPGRARLLATEWGIGVDAVQACSAEASRIARGYYPQREEAQIKVIDWLEESVEMAREQKNPTAMTTAALAYSKVTGADAPQKVAITNAAGEDLPAYVRKDWPIEVWNWALAQGRVVGEAEMAAKAEELAEAAKGKAGT